MLDFFDFVSATTLIVAILGTIGGWLLSVILIVTGEAAGKRIPILTNLWLAVGGTYVAVIASVQAMIAAGAEPSGASMGAGLMLTPVVLAGAPVVLLMSAITLVREPVKAKIKLLSWMACLILASVATSVAAYAAWAITLVLVGLPAVWCVQAIRD